MSDNGQTEDRAAVLFEQACALPNEQARRAWIAEACRDEPDLRAELQSMLDAHTAQGSFLADPTSGLTIAAEPLAEQPGDVIGR
ncbi:MAG: hypothetical protein ACYTGC_18480, partial [Planctomycetota bacterium]